jgi:hypothetical protein
MPASKLQSSKGQTGNSPFPGLRPYRTNESEYFGGRDQQKYQILKSLGDSNFLAVAGDKGQGKSSFINAVVIPELRKGFVARGNKEWKIASFRPGRDPLGALASAMATIPAQGSNAPEKLDPNLTEQFEKILRGSKTGIIEILETNDILNGSNLLINVDHLDDLVFEDESSGESQRPDYIMLIEQLVECSAQSAYPISVLVSLRTESMGKFSEHLQFAEILNKNQFILGPLPHSEILNILEKTGRRSHLQFGPKLLKDVHDHIKNKGLSLGAFQHAMMRSYLEWKSSDVGGEIGLEQLEAIGGLHGSIDQQLESIYNSLNAEEKDCCKLSFQALTGYSQLGENYIIPRRISELSTITLYSESLIIGVLEKFIAPECSAVSLLKSEEIDSRLERLDSAKTDQGDVLTTNSILCVSQEVVMETWARLSTWIDEERRDSLLYTDIGRDVNKDEPPYQGEKLKTTLEWYEQRQPHAGWAMRYGANFGLIEDFIQRSKEKHEQEKARMAAEENARKRVRARNQVIVGAFVIGLVVLLFVNYQAGKRSLEQSRQAKVALELAKEKSKEASDSQVRASLESKKAEMASKEAKRKKEEASRASLMADREREIADSIKRKSDSLNIEFDAKSADLSMAISKVEESRKLEEFLNLLEQVRELSESARNKILNNPEDEVQLNLAVNTAWEAYQKYSETGFERFAELDDSVTVLKDYSRKNLFSTMNLAYQRAKSFPLLSDVDHGIIIDDFPSSAPSDGNGEFLIGTSEENAIIRVQVLGGEVAGVVPVVEMANQKAMVRGIKDLELSASEQYFLVSNLPVDQEGRYISLFETSGTFKTAVNMPKQVEKVYPFNRNEFLLVDQSSNIYRLSSLAKDSLDTLRIYNMNLPLKAVDYNSEQGVMVLAHSNRKMVFLKIGANGDPSEYSDLVPEEFNGEVTALKYIPKHDLLAVGTIKGGLYLYNLKSQELFFSATDEHANRINCLELSGDESLLVSGGRDKKMNVWNLEELIKITTEGKSFKPIRFEETESIRDIAFVGNKWILSVSSNEGFGSSRGGKVSLFTLDFDLTGKELGKLSNKP